MKESFYYRRPNGSVMHENASAEADRYLCGLPIKDGDVLVMSTTEQRRPDISPDGYQLCGVCFEADPRYTHAQRLEHRQQWGKAEAAKRIARPTACSEPQCPRPQPDRSATSPRWSRNCSPSAGSTAMTRNSGASFTRTGSRRTEASGAPSTSTT